MFQGKVKWGTLVRRNNAGGAFSIRHNAGAFAWNSAHTTIQLLDMTHVEAVIKLKKNHRPGNENKSKNNILEISAGFWRKFIRLRQSPWKALLNLTQM